MTLTTTLTKLENIYDITLPDYVKNLDKSTLFYTTCSYDGFSQIWILQLQKDNSVRHLGTFLEDTQSYSGEYTFFPNTEKYKSLIDVSSKTMSGYIESIFEGVEIPKVEYDKSVKDITQYRNDRGYYFYNSTLDEFIEFTLEEVKEDMLKREDFNLTEKEYDILSEYECISITPQGMTIEDNNDFNSDDFNYISVMTKILNQNTTSIDIQSLMNDYKSLITIEGFGETYKSVVTLVINIEGCMDTYFEEYFEENSMELEEEIEFMNKVMSDYSEEVIEECMETLNLNKESNLKFECYSMDRIVMRLY